MGSGMVMAEMSPAPAHDQMKMADKASDGCEEMGGKARQTHDAGCAAACALACPGFYCAPDRISAQPVAFHTAQYLIPATNPGMVTPSHLDPPPPRV